MMMSRTVLRQSPAREPFSHRGHSCCRTGLVELILEPEAPYASHLRSEVLSHVMPTRKRALESNRQRWDALVPLHVKSRFYSVDEFRKGKTSLQSVELTEVGSVRGKDLLHLQCHFGMDTLSWARMGARVTGVDFAPEAIRMAKSLSKELGIPARFVCSDIYEMPGRLKGKFDVVFTSYGILCWLPDLPGWGRVVARYLRPGGTFHLVESHPFAQLLDDEGDVPRLSARGRYFGDGDPDTYTGRCSYADGKLDRKMTSYEWPYTVSKVVNALTEAGLHLEFLHEFPFEVWKRYPWFVRGKDGYWHSRKRGVAYPLIFSLKATKPA